MSPKTILTILLVTIFCTLAKPQTAMNNLAEQVEKSAVDQSPEFLYVQTSKDIYETGEDVWFKAYVMQSQALRLSSLSQTLYLQVFNESDSIVWQEKYPIENGVSAGHMYLDEKLSAGIYSIEAYTRHSFHADSAEFKAIRKIRVVNKIADYRLTQETTDKDFRFSLFPEGGTLVNGLRSNLAFKATDGKGNPVEVSGVLAENGTTIVSFESTHAGMGTITFKPDKNKTYLIQLNNGKQYALPEIRQQGMVLNLQEQNKERLAFVVSKSDELPQQPVYLLGQMRGMVCCIARGLLQDSLRVQIPLTEFPMQGIAEFTLYNSHLQPIAERLVYVHSDKKLYITAQPDKGRYKTREKASLKIKVTDENNNPISAHLGMTVFDKAYIDDANPVNIMTHCFLSSQLRGNIYHPAYYFNEENKDSHAALDLLMLTQGWRRYVWNAFATPVAGEHVLTDEITGRQTFQSEKKSKDINSGEQLIQISGADGDPEFIWTDSAGYFSVSPDLQNKLRGGYIYLKPMLDKKYTPRIELRSDFNAIAGIRKLKNSTYPFVDMSRLKRNYVPDVPIVTVDSVILLNELTVTGKKGRPFRDKMMGRLDSLAQINLNPAWVCECLPGYLNDYRPGYTHHPSGGARSGRYDGKRLAPIHGKIYRMIKYEPREDGIWHVKDIQEVEYRGPYYTDEELLEMNNIFREKGYYGNREFYQPDEFDMQTSVPDARNTLLWAPNVITDEKGEATLSFYCSDINTEFTARIEGLNNTGLIGMGNCEFRVLRDINNK